jgi:hypothetical protein
MRDLTIRRSLRGAIYTRVSSSSYKLIGPQWGKRFVIFEHLWAAEFVRLCLRGLLQRGELAFGQHQTLPQATLASSALSRFFIVSRSWRCQTPRIPAGEIEWPSLRSSLAMRIWP